MLYSPLQYLFWVFFWYRRTVSEVEETLFQKKKKAYVQSKFSHDLKECVKQQRKNIKKAKQQCFKEWRQHDGSNLAFN